MKYNFDELTDRRGTSSLKWDEASDFELPMWVGDMDFKTAPCVSDAIERRLRHGIFGYNTVPEEWYRAISDRWESAHGFKLNEDWLIFATGVVPAISSSVKRITSHGDNVAVITPSYNVFFNSIENAGRHTLEVKMDYKDGEYSLDFDDLEKKLSHYLTTMLILCNPHNPSGKIWTKEELSKIGELCKEYGVTVLSDEIHCDIVRPGKSYTPFASVNEVCRDISVTCVSASKAFNLAGLQSACVIVPERNLRNKIIRCLNSDELAEPNSFAVCSVIAAFSEGGEWLSALNDYIFENRRICEEFIKSEIPSLTLVKSDATYFLWIDCSQLTSDGTEFRDFIRSETGLRLSDGEEYRGNGKSFVRMNIATARQRVYDGLSRLKAAVEKYKK